MSHFSSRKGNITLWVVFELITVATILVLLISTAYSKAEGQDIQLNYLAKDIALMVDMLHALPGDVILYYPFPEFNTDITLQITNDSVSTESFGTKRAQFFFIPSQQISVADHQIDIEKETFFALPLRKEGKAIHFSDTNQQSSGSSSLPVPRLSTREEDLSNNQIIFSVRFGTERTEAFIRQMILSTNEPFSADQVQAVSLEQGSESINALHPNLFINIELREETQISELLINYGIDEQIEPQSQKLATLLYNAITRSVHIDQARLAIETGSGSEREQTIRDIRSPRVSITLSESAYLALGDRKLGELIGQVIATYYHS